MAEKSVWIINRFGEKLEAVIRIPMGEEQFPAVLFVSGFGANLHEQNNSFDEISNILVNHGFVTMQFSFAGRGKSEGNYDDMTQKRQAQQINDVLAWFRSQKFVDPSRIGIIALSFGVASTLAADVSSVKSLLLLSGVYFPLERMQEMFVSKGEYHSEDVSWRKQSDGSISRVGTEFWNVLKTFDTKKACSFIQAPVYLVHGDQDSKITVGEVEKAFTCFSSKKKEMKIYPGGDHGIIDVPRVMREEFLSDVIAWFGKTL